MKILGCCDDPTMIFLPKIDRCVFYMRAIHSDEDPTVIHPDEDVCPLKAHFAQVLLEDAQSSRHSAK